MTKKKTEFGQTLVWKSVVKTQTKKHNSLLTNPTVAVEKSKTVRPHIPQHKTLTGFPLQLQVTQKSFSRFYFCKTPIVAATS